MLSFPMQSTFQGQGNLIKLQTWVLIPPLILTGLVLRFSGLSFVSYDMHDFLLGWYDRLATDGFAAFREPFSNYAPLYLYLLCLITKTARFLPGVVAIKLLSIFFDLLNAALVYKILRIKYPQGATAWIGASCFLLLPIALLNSSYWGQSDAIYTCFVLVCVLFLMKQKPFLAIIGLGVSFAFKAQAAFIGPLILLLIVRKKIPWFYLGIIPGVYGLMMIPALLTGRPLIELLTVYTSQVNTYRTLSSYAPNLYVFIPNTLYNSALVIGLAITAIIALTWVTLYARTVKEFNPETILLCALVSVAFMPFFLPKMHDRYFYLAEVLSFLVACYFPSKWFLAVGYQFVSGLIYSVVLIRDFMPIAPALLGNTVILAALVNAALMVYVFRNQWTFTNDTRDPATQIQFLTSDALSNDS